MDGPPFALNDLAGMLTNEEVRILDLRAVFDRQPKCDIENEVYRELKEFDPEIIGVTCMMAQVNPARAILEIVREYNEKILTIVGGIHPTACPHDFSEFAVNLIVIGLGKRTIIRIVDEYKKKSLET